MPVNGGAYSNFTTLNIRAAYAAYSVRVNETAAVRPLFCTGLNQRPERFRCRVAHRPITGLLSFELPDLFPGKSRFKVLLIRD
jgi:hypothetical protein